MTVLAMSHGELSRFDTLMRVERGELRVEDAAILLGLKRRQVFRLLERMRTEGASGLVSRKRGQPSNRRHSDVFRDQIVAIVREHYHDFGPTLAREYLVERHGITLACETLRQLMIQAGLWKDRNARRRRPHQPRYRLCLQAAGVTCFWGLISIDPDSQTYASEYCSKDREGQPS